jgi:hypothetical protein
MKFTIKLALFSALIYATMAVNGPIKNKLSEANNKRLVEIASECETEICTLAPIATPSLSFCPGTTGATPGTGSTGSASSTAYGSVISASSNQITGQDPNKASVSNCNGNC